MPHNKFSGIGIIITCMIITGSLMIPAAQSVFAQNVPNMSPVVIHRTFVAWVIPGIYGATYRVSIQERSLLAMQWLLRGVNKISRPSLVRRNVISNTHTAAPAVSSGWSAFRASMRRSGGGGGSNSTDSGNSQSTTLTMPSISFNDVTKGYGDADFSLLPTSNSTGGFSYTSSNEDVATVSGNVVTITGVGTTTITATQQADGLYASGSATASLTVNGIAPTITFGDLTKSRIDPNFTLGATSDSPGAITYTSGNTGLVTISGTTADIVGTHGTTTITASQAASGNYAAGSAFMTLTVFHTYCIAAPCLFGGTCVPTLEGALTDDNFVCECPDDTSGDDCGIYDDECEEPGYCNSGECIPDYSGGACGNCAPCLEGDRCQTAILNCQQATLPAPLVCLDEHMTRAL